MPAIELKTEAAAVGQAQRERFTPTGRLTTMLYAIAKGVAKTMAALHERTVATLELVGRNRRYAIELTGLTIGNIVQLRMGVELGVG